MRKKALAQLVVWLVLAGSPAEGQRSDARAAAPRQSTVVEGLVVDALTGRPVPRVQLRFDSGERVTTDRDGRYHIEDVPAGRRRIALVTARCNVTFAELVLGPGEIRGVAFQIPSEVAAREEDQEERKRSSEGEFYTTADLRAMPVQTLAEALRRVAPEMMGPLGAQPGSVSSLRGRTRGADAVRVPVVVLDDVVVGDGARLLEAMKLAEVATLEILKGASRGWSYGTGGSGGVIRIQTRHGEYGAGTEHPDRCEIENW